MSEGSREIGATFELHPPQQTLIPTFTPGSVTGTLHFSSLSQPQYQSRFQDYDHLSNDACTADDRPHVHTIRPFSYDTAAYSASFPAVASVPAMKPQAPVDKNISPNRNIRTQEHSSSSVPTFKDDVSKRASSGDNFTDGFENMTLKEQSMLNPSKAVEIKSEINANSVSSYFRRNAERQIEEQRQASKAAEDNAKAEKEAREAVERDRVASERIAAEVKAEREARDAEEKVRAIEKASAEAKAKAEKEAREAVERDELNEKELTAAAEKARARAEAADKERVREQVHEEEEESKYADKKAEEESSQNTEKDAAGESTAGQPYDDEKVEMTDEKIIGFFDRLDRNKDGVVSKVDVIKALKSQKRSSVSSVLHLPREIRQEDGSRDIFMSVFHEIDKSAKGTITLTDIRKYLKSRINISKST